MTSEPIASDTSVEPAIRTAPAAVSAQAAWLVRTAPQRRTSLPVTNETATAPE